MRILSQQSIHAIVQAERAQPKPTEKNQLYANFGRRREDAPAPTPEQVAAAQARREAAARHQEVPRSFPLLCLPCPSLQVLNAP